MLKLAGRSARKFERELHRAVVKHDELIECDRLSVKPAVGRLAVLHSYGVTTNSPYDGAEQREIFSKEAHEVAESELASMYGDVEVRPLATKLDMNLVIQDEQVAGIVVIGHGTIAAVRMPQERFYNWRDAERAVRHLKLGHFVQRMCGFMKLEHSVPLGTFVVADQRQLIAAPGIAIADKNPDESLFEAVYDNPVNSVTQILAVRDDLYAIETNGDASDGILNTDE